MMARRKPILTIVSAVYNEADIIEDFVRKCYEEICKKIPSEILIAEDGSTDGTKEILLRLKKKYPLRLIMEKEKKGFQRAIRDALKEVRTPLVFYSDPDQWEPKDFWLLYNKIKDYDLIVGKKRKREDPAYRKFIGWGHATLVKYMFNLPVFDMDSGYKLIKREVLKDVLPEIRTLRDGFQTELTVRTYYKGYKITEVPVTHKLRPAGTGTTRTFDIRSLLKVIPRHFMNLLRLKGELNGRLRKKPLRAPPTKNL